jgi:hypothetical protein
VSTTVAVGRHDNGPPPALNKLRSGSVMVTPRAAHAIVDGIEALDDEEIEQRAAEVAAAAAATAAALAAAAPSKPTAAADNGTSASSSSAIQPLEVEVVRLEQIGVDTLQSQSVSVPSSPTAGDDEDDPTKKKQNGRTPPRPYAGRSTNTVYFSHGFAPSGINTLRGRQAAAAAAGGSSRPAVAASTFEPIADDDAADVDAAPSVVETEADAARPSAPTRAVPPLIDLAAASSAAASSSTSPSSRPLSLDTSTPVALADEDAAVAQYQQQQLFSTPSKGGDSFKNPLQSPVAPRSQLTAAEMEPKNPLQSPAVGQRRSALGTVPAATFFELTPIINGSDGSTTNGQQHHSAVPLPPLHSLNDADLLKNPLQSPAPLRRCSVHPADVVVDALPPPAL